LRFIRANETEVIEHTADVRTAQSHARGLHWDASGMTSACAGNGGDQGQRPRRGAPPSFAALWERRILVFTLRESLPPADNVHMLWLYKRGLQDVRIQASFDSATNEYVLVIKRGLHNEKVERFKARDSYGDRIEALELELTRDRWVPVGPPFLLQECRKVG
jgi:hypothetical protein